MEHPSPWNVALFALFVICMGISLGMAERLTAYNYAKKQQWQAHTNASNPKAHWFVLAAAVVTGYACVIAVSLNLWSRHTALWVITAAVGLVWTIMLVRAGFAYKKGEEWKSGAILD